MARETDLVRGRARRSQAAASALLLLAGLAAGALAPAAAHAATYYVRTSGSDAASGLSPADAWQTLRHAAAEAEAGDTVYIGAGTYTDAVDVKNSGTAGAPIRFVADESGAWTGDAGPAVLDTGGDAFKIDKHDFVHVIGLRVTGAKKAFKLKQAVGLLVEDCEVDGNDLGFEIDKAAVTIRGCDVHDNFEEGIEIKNQAVATLEDISVRSNGRVGILLDNPNASLSVSRCDLRSNGGAGLHVKKGAASAVNCLLTGNGAAGVWLEKDSALLDAWHLTVAGNAGPGVRVELGAATLQNSIVAFQGGVGLEVLPGATLAHDFNLVHGNGGGNYAGTVAGPAEIDLDPLFVGPGDWHLQPVSPAVDAGTDASAITTEDRDAVERPQALGFDMGAYENDGNLHFAIDHDGSAVHCQAEPVTVTVHNGVHDVATAYTGSILLSTSTGHGDWSLVSGSGTLTNAGGGSATYGFDPADAGVVVLGLRDTFTETVNIDVVAGSFAEDPLEDPDLAFASAGFQFLADGVASAVGTQVGGKPSNVAPGAQLLELQAIRTDDQTGACEAGLQGPNDVELAFTCVDPTTCAGPLVSLNGTSLPANDLGAPLSYAPVSLDFGDDTDSTAPFVMAWGDVGRIRLHARLTLSPSGESLLGASNDFVVRPFAFQLAVPGNPGATAPTGPVFAAAGADFPATVRAVLWQPGDDLDADGLADGHGDADPANNADLSDNGSALSFGRETSPEGVLLDATLVAPAGGSDPGLGGTVLVAPFAAGQGTAPAIFFDEVGVAELGGAVADGDYLGIGGLQTALVRGRSGPVGRFVPDHFDVEVDTAPLFQTGCDPGAYTYQGQPFVYAQAPILRVRARSARNTQTANYTGAWWKLTNGSLGAPAYASDPAAPAALDTSGLPAPGLDPMILDLGDGSGTLTFASGAGLRFTRAGAVAPFDAEIALAIDVVDEDGVAYASNPFRVGDASAGNGIPFTTSKEMRYGRVAMDNAHGSELLPLPVPLRAEFFNGVGFVPHTADACTVIPTASLGTTARSPAALATTPSLAHAPLLGGDAGLVLSPPGLEGTADLLVNLAGPDVATPWGPIVGAGLDWLQWDWSGGGAGPPTQNPTARATFGIYAGQRPVIFRREVY